MALENNTVMLHDIINQLTESPNCRLTLLERYLRQDSSAGPLSQLQSTFDVISFSPDVLIIWWVFKQENHQAELNPEPPGLELMTLRQILDRGKQNNTSSPCS